MAIKRPLPLPDDVRAALELSDLMPAYDSRPDGQRNGYISWIEESRRDVFRRKRIRQMLDELDAGTIYLGSDWSGGACAIPKKKGR